MSTLDDFQRRITKNEAEIVEIKKTLEELKEVMEPAAIGPPMPVFEVPTEKIVEEAVEEAHAEVSEEKPEEETSEEE